MKPHDEPHGLCCIDPVSLATMALGGIVAGGATAAASQAMTPSPTPVPAATPTPPPTPAAAAPPSQSPIGGKAQQRPQTSTFLGTQAAAAPQQTGNKTLLGQ